MKNKPENDDKIAEYITNYGDGIRPTVRGECYHFNICPFVTCRYHLYLDVDEYGNIIYNYPGKQPYELEETCALKVADERSGTGPQGKLSLNEIVKIMGLSKEGIRQIAVRAMKKIAEDPIYSDFSDYKTDGLTEKTMDPDKTNYPLLGEVEIERIYMDEYRWEEEQDHLSYGHDYNLY